MKTRVKEIIFAVCILIMFLGSTNLFAQVLGPRIAFFTDHNSADLCVVLVNNPTLATEIVIQTNTAHRASVKMHTERHWNHSNTKVFILRQIASVRKQCYGKNFESCIPMGNEMNELELALLGTDNNKKLEQRESENFIKNLSTIEDSSKEKVRAAVKSS